MITAERPAPGLQDWGALLLLGLLWGGSFLAIELALESLPPLTLAAGRIAIAALILGALAAALGHRMPRWSDDGGPLIWASVTGMAFLSNAIPFTLLSWAQQEVTSGFAGITMAAVPLLVLPLAHVFVPGERMTLGRATGFGIGFCGVVILIGPGALGGDEASMLAQAACIAVSACYACGSIVTRLCPPVSLIAFSAAALTLASLAMVPTALIIDGPPPIPGRAALAGLLYLGILPTALATLLLVQVIRRAGPSFLSLVNYQIPLWAVAIGALALDERVPRDAVIALALILAGLAISQGRRRV